MANNRLYIGNKETLEYIALSKHYCTPFELSEQSLIKLKNFIESPEQYCSDECIFEFFTEYDEIHNKYLK